MVKAIISALIGLALVITASFLETCYVHKTFEQTSEALSVIYEKTKQEITTEEDVVSVLEEWFKKKEKLHIFIPHNEIKEIDLWLSEAVTLIKNSDYTEALYKIEVALTLIEQISKTFSFRLENIL